MRHVAACILLFATALAGSCNRHDPPPLPARIISGSMAERYYGEHWQVVCDDCGFTFRCGVEQPPDSMLAICPNCGFRENRVDAAAKRPGMAVEVAPRDFAKLPPQRWEVVAYRDDDSERVQVKRVVGLPGERLAIRGGDLFVDERRLQKSLREFHEAAQLVHDNAHRPSSVVVASSRHGSNTARDATAGSHRHELSERWRTAGDWLEYHHWSCAATPTPRDADAPIRDNDSYNQGLSRAMNTVGDVLLSFTVDELREVTDSSELVVRLYGGEQPLVVAILPNADIVRVLHGDRQLAEAPTSTPLVSARDWKVSAGVVDGRVLVEIGQQETLAFDLDAAGIVLDVEHVSLAIGKRSVNGDLSNLQVLRDVYYLNPLGRPDDWQMPTPLGEGEYFLLGDNPPLSRDSRQHGGIGVGRIVGGVRQRSE